MCALAILRGCALLPLLPLLPPPPALADQIHVPGDQPYIQSAIFVARDGDEVVVAPGVHAGPNNRNIDFLGKAITVRGTAPDDPQVVAATIVNCQQEGRGFIFQHGETLASVIDGLTITNGFATDGPAVYLAGSSSATIRRCMLTAHTAPPFAGVIDASEVNLEPNAMVVDRCTIQNNQGTGLRASFLDALTVSGTTISGNSGSGIVVGPLAAAELLVEACAISGNGGPGIDADATSTAMRDCTITDNAGTGILLAQGFTGGAVVISNCIVSGNTSTDTSGGLWLEVNTNGVVRNCLVADNVGSSGGGLLLSGFGAIEIVGCTIAGNLASGFGGGGIAAFGADPVAIANTIVWGNAAAQGAQLLLASGFNDPSVVSVEFSAVEGGAKQAVVGNDGCCTPSVLIYGDGNIELDPLFADPATGDHHLSARSPCVDAGDPAFIAEAGESDLDGEPRVVGEAVDMGADEFCASQDVNCDAIVDVLDLVELIVQWGACPDPPADCSADVNGDGTVDVLDLVELLLHWG
jgi:hypothetical protein